MVERRASNFADNAIATTRIANFDVIMPNARIFAIFLENLRIVFGLIFEYGKVLYYHIIL
jgi:hypothetical protein